MRYEKEYNLAMEAARLAGDYLKGLREVLVDCQEGKDIKLEADRESEKRILSVLQTSQIPVLSEECGYTGIRRENRIWIIDPLDGSANFWKGLRELSCVSVALWEGGKPLLGVINRFWQNEIYSGIVDEGAWLNGHSIKTSDVSRIDSAILATGFPVKRNYSENSLKEFITNVQHFKKIRMLGAAALMGAFVAAGKIDVYMEEQIMLWDIAASSAIVKAAGGTAEIRFLEKEQCVCSLFANQVLLEAYKDCIKNIAVC